MNNTDLSRDIPHSDWHLLDKFELPVDSKSTDAHYGWLSNVLNSLGLHAQLLSRIMDAVQDSVGRALTSEWETEFRHLHLLVHVPGEPASSGQNWGFFQIEKVGNSTEGGERLDHAIELYLYPEG